MGRDERWFWASRVSSRSVFVFVVVGASWVVFVEVDEVLNGAAVFVRCCQGT